MSAGIEFWNWWTSRDWGKPNSLTRIGVPRLVTNLVAYLLAPYLAYELTVRWVPAADYRTYRVFAHNAFFVAAYIVLYVSYLAHEFLSFKYNARGRTLDRLLLKKWNDPFVRILWMSLTTLFALFLIGCLQVWSRSR
jgi:hypothetical protein